MDEKDFAIRLARLREKKGVSARDMSLSIGQNPGYINSIETGKFKPSSISPFTSAPSRLYNSGKAVCGAKGCTRACMISLERRGVLKNKFHAPFRTEKQWSVDWEEEAIKVDYTPPYEGLNSPNAKKTDSDTD